jgi:tetratricopeptide (TPR) repeat protein/DNA-binding CsgD family transcriptional regulator
MAWGDGIDSIDHDTPRVSSRMPSVDSGTTSPSACADPAALDMAELDAMLGGALDERTRLAVLNALAAKLVRVEPTRARSLAEEAVTIARDCNEPSAEASALRTLAGCLETLSEYEAAMELARRAEAMYRAIGDEIGVANALISVGIIARDLSDHRGALDAFARALEIFAAHDDEPRMAAAYNNLGTIHQDIGSYAEALDAYLAALRIHEKRGEELSAAIVTSNLAIIYYYLNDIDASYSYSTAIALGNISGIYRIRGDFDAARAALEEAMSIFLSLGERRYVATTEVKLGSLHDARGDAPSALAHLERAAALAEEVGDMDTLADALHRTGEVHRARGAWREAIAAQRRAVAIAEELGLTKLSAEIHTALAAAHEATRATAKALAHLKRASALREQLFGEERQRAIAEMQTRFDVDKAERERELLRLRNEHLEELMEQRARELTSTAMQVVRKNAFLQRLRKEAGAVAADEPAAAPAVEKLLRAIDENLHGDEDWKRFEQEFQLVHHDFIRRLSERYPRLTPTELRVCALLKINLSNKEIADLLSVSLRNVETHRYWIRKKLGLATEASLSGFLATQ